MLKKLFVLFVLLPNFVLAADFWLPASIVVTNTGDLAHSLPFPSSGKTGGTGFESGADFSSGIGAGFFPIVAGNYTRSNRIYAVSDDPKGKKALEPIAPGLFTEANPSGGFRHILSSDGSLTLGGGVSLGPPGWAILNVTLGAAVASSKGYTANRFVQNKDAIKKLPSVKLPHNAKTLVDDWNVGDSLSYTKSMSIAFNAAAGAGPLAVGIAAMASSTWDISLSVPNTFYKAKTGMSKVGDFDPVVSLEYSKDKNAGVQVNATALLGGVSLDKIWGKSKSLAYTFNLANTSKTDVKIKTVLLNTRISRLSSQIKKQLAKQGVEYKTIDGGKAYEIIYKNISALDAYQAALKGDLVLADKLAKLKNYGVVKNSESEKTYKTTKRGAFASVPFLIGVNFSKGNTYSITKTKQLDENTYGFTQMGIYNKDYSTSGLLSSDTRRTEMFTGNFQQIEDLSEQTTLRRYSANYKYVFEKNGSNISDLQSELKKIRYKVGFMKKLREELSIPMNADKLGSLKLELDIRLSDGATNQLIGIAEKMGMKNLISEATSYLDGFAKNVEDAKKEICRNPKLRIFKECIFTTKRQTVDAMKKAYWGLISMKNARNQNNYEKFVKGYADFGEGFVENRFTLKTFLRLLRYVCPPSKYLALVSKVGDEEAIKQCPARTGRDVAPYKIDFSFTSTNMAPKAIVLFSNTKEVKAAGHNISKY